MAQQLRISCHEEHRRRLLLLHIVQRPEKIFWSKRLAWDRFEW
jgi:hypothetical protein